MRRLSAFVAAAALLLWLTVPSCRGSEKGAGSVPAPSGEILLNQVGYQPASQKVALVRCNSEKFVVREAAGGRVVFRGSCGKPRYWSYSGDTVRSADFSQLVAPGRYLICTEGKEKCSAPFTISDTVYRAIAAAAVKAFYYNRSGFEITGEYGGKWARAEGHPDTSVIIHRSAASPSRAEGTLISSPGGWYDAGDYNKYIVNSGITTYTLLLFYRMFPEYCRSQQLNIPESNNNIPDVVDELLYNLKWMMTMQDPADGGVYHKLTNKDFDGFEMPAADGQPRYVVQKSTAAALDFAAVMAAAARIFAGDPSSELRELSRLCATAAARAYGWAKINPGIIYMQPPDISTGVYGDRDLSDEWYWANTEMALLKNDISMLPPVDTPDRTPGQLSWNRVKDLGLYSLALSGNPLFNEAATEATAVLKSYADTLLRKSEESAYRVSIDYFYWGSNSDVANQAMLKQIVMRITGDDRYLPSVQGDIDYLLGRNATGYCFVTGFGSKSPMHIHHRPSGADSIPEPVPGFLVGGPNLSVPGDCIPAVKRSEYPAKSYSDLECSYSTNEICINWNAPLVFVLGAMDAAGEQLQ